MKLADKYSPKISLSNIKNDPSLLQEEINLFSAGIYPLIILKSIEKRESSVWAKSTISEC